MSGTDGCPNSIRSQSKRFRLKRMRFQSQRAPSFQMRSISVHIRAGKQIEDKKRDIPDFQNSGAI
jgi:hypothetical protein